jgi:quinolinate synthase
LSLAACGGRVKQKPTLHGHAALTRHPLLHYSTGVTGVERFVWARGTGSLPATTTHVLSTEGMVKRARTSPAATRLVATETGLLAPPAQRGAGQDTLLAADEGAVCRDMKQITLPKLRNTLRDLQPEVEVEPQIAAQARRASERLLAIRG